MFEQSASFSQLPYELWLYQIFHLIIDLEASYSSYMNAKSPEKSIPNKRVKPGYLDKKYYKESIQIEAEGKKKSV